jgi:hypothetical protein
MFFIGERSPVNYLRWDFDGVPCLPAIFRNDDFPSCANGVAKLFVGKPDAQQQAAVFQLCLAVHVFPPSSEAAISSSAPHTQRVPLFSAIFNGRAGSSTVRHSEANEGAA